MENKKNPKNEAAKTAENVEATSLDNLAEQEINGEKIKGGTWGHNMHSAFGGEGNTSA